MSAVAPTQGLPLLRATGGASERARGLMGGSGAGLGPAKAAASPAPNLGLQRTRGGALWKKCQSRRRGWSGLTGLSAGLPPGIVSPTATNKLVTRGEIDRSPTGVAVDAAVGVFIHPVLRLGRVLVLVTPAVLVLVGEEADEAKGVVV
eukprot:CAMPEP_0184118870 /NCGR_PEP_ID=MMETSP0974-20121125/21659_1 /TAXON_ID=483370 /ORGANISM="non described non described, Strain CCMP2097" /LENGTH=147 /DNA_ID=CAMNT_0026422019 /DNA_START=211 /DNA_END=652 /DNA_ORIENTATION=+